MKEIKTKPTGGKPKVLDSAAKLPKVAAKQAWIQAKQKAVQESKQAAPGNRPDEPSSNAPANNASEQMVYAAKTVAVKGGSITYKGGKRLAQVTAKKLREQRRLIQKEEIRFNSMNRTDMVSSPQRPPDYSSTPHPVPRTSYPTGGRNPPLSPTQSGTSNVSRFSKDVRNPVSRASSDTKRFVSKQEQARRASREIKKKQEQSIKTAKASVKGIKKTIKKIKSRQDPMKRVRQAKKAQKTAARMVRRAQQAAKAAAKTAKATVRAVISATKAMVAATKSLIAAIAAGGWIAVVIILLICLIALVVGSVFGIFFGAESTGTGTSVTQAVTLLNGEYQQHIQEISERVSHDRQETESNDGVPSIRWEDVLAVFASRETGDEAGSQVASLDDDQIDRLRSVMWEMNQVSHSTRTERHETENGGSRSETVLVITIIHKTPQEMAQTYQFNDRQREYLDLMVAPENANLWSELLGGFTSGGGAIIAPDTDWTGTDIFAWPLPQSFTITSYFGYRNDPFTGKPSYHNGTDIAAPAGTPILAAADGTVVIANGTDSWGGGYGYYMKIKHTDSLETLYAHCSSIGVVSGQKVKQGEVIGYVGTTGSSTGNHLHFEVRVNGTRTDALAYFKSGT